jgi:ribosomal protein L37AE/L43A
MAIAAPDAGAAEKDARPELYETRCPACVGTVVFSLVRDANNLMCPHCDNLFDASSAYKRAEVVAAIVLQRHARGRLERLERRFAQRLVEGRKYRVPCPSCSLVVGFTPERSSTACCPSCGQVFDGAAAMASVSEEVAAAVRMQARARGQLSRSRSRAQLAPAEAPVASAARIELEASPVRAAPLA